MKEQYATSENLNFIIKSIEPGTIIQLSPGKYTDPVIIEHFSGNPENPLIIRGAPGVVFDGGKCFSDFEPEACKEVKKGEHYPSLAHIAYRAFFRIYYSSGITIENLAIRGYWPTGIYFNESRDLRFANLAMQEATFAIYGEGDGSSDILVEDCTWLQDASEMQLWSVLGWNPLHSKNDCICGARGYDGAFFRTRNIEGNVVIRRNIIRHAANGVHMFNRRAEKGKRRKGLNNNVQIYGNRFEYIRDNAIEPERRAVNWWVHNNEIFNCHKPFSLEMDTYGYFYIFGNRAWFDSKPGPPSDEHTGGGMFKLPKEVEKHLGPFYVFNNSWYLRSSYIKDGLFQSFYHWNNAIAYCLKDEHRPGDCSRYKPFFGGAKPGVDDASTAHFTKEWEDNQIEFHNDCVRHPGFPDVLVHKGWNIVNGIGADPLFENPRQGQFKLKTQSPLFGAAMQKYFELPNGAIWPPVDEPYPIGSIGAYQGESIITGPAFVPYPEGKETC